MSDFLFILPQGWTQLPAHAIDAIPSGIGTAEMWVDSSNFADLTLALQEAGQLPANQYIEEAKIFNGDILVVRIITQ